MYKVTIFGERCSGTNYLEELLIKNFDVEITWEYGWKHFFGFNNFKNSDNVLFLGIIRNVNDWINSFYRQPHHLPKALIENEDTFLNNEFYSEYNNGAEIMIDRNIETNERYKNIFELRHIKNKFLIETMPKLVKNYLLIVYDDLINNFIETMYKIKYANLKIKNNIEFPLNITHHSLNKSIKFVKKNNIISKEKILNKVNTHYEKILFPDEFL